MTYFLFCHFHLSLGQRVHGVCVCVGGGRVMTSCPPLPAPPTLTCGGPVAGAWASPPSWSSWWACWARISSPPCPPFGSRPAARSTWAAACSISPPCPFSLVGLEFWSYHLSSAFPLETFSWSIHRMFLFARNFLCKAMIMKRFIMFFLLVGVLRKTVRYR